MHYTFADINSLTSVEGLKLLNDDDPLLLLLLPTLFISS